MFTDRRLTSAYKRALVEQFDNRSNYVFFSDIHRGDDSVSDEFARNQQILLHALEYYYHQGYIYVEVGDGDELWEHSDFKHIRYAHSDVFLGIKKFYDDNRLRLIYGNHNIYFKNKSYVTSNLFRFYDEYKQNQHDLFPGIRPIESLVLKKKDTAQEIYIVHGHQGDMMNDQLWYFSMLLSRYFWRYLHVVGFHSPASPAKNLFKRHKIEKKYKVWIRNHRIPLICGHTHRPRFPKNGELPYFNTGCCIHSKGITGIEITNGNILMVDWRIKADKKGALHIVRTVVRGPAQIERYNFSKKEF